MGMWWRRAGEGAGASGSACPRGGGGFFLLSFFFLKFNLVGLTFRLWYTEGPGEEIATPVKADAFLYLGSVAGG